MVTQSCRTVNRLLDKGLVPLSPTLDAAHEVALKKAYYDPGAQFPFDARTDPELAFSIQGDAFVISKGTNEA